MHTGKMYGGGRLLVVVLLAVTVVHLPGLRTGYVYDDVEAILENPALRQWSEAPALFRTNYWGERNIGLYRPLVQLSYLIDGAGFGFDPRVSHGINLLLHLVVVALVFLLGLGLELSNARCGALALLFGVHPAHLDASVWISGRTDVLAALFVIAGLLCALSAARRQEGMFGIRTWCLGVSYLLGLFSKEMAVTLPVLVIFLPGRGHLRRLPLLCVAFAVYMAFRATAVEGFLPSHAGDGAGALLAERSVWERVALGARACWRLLLFVLVPVGLSADHRAHAWAQPDSEAYVPGGWILLATWVALALIFRKAASRTAFFFGGTLIALVPVLQIVPIGAVMAERFLYLPMIFLLGFCVEIVAATVSEGRRPLAAASVIVLAGILSFMTISRIPIYATRGSYCEDVLRSYPNDYKAWNNLGVFRFLEQDPPDFEEAEAAFYEAQRLKPRYRRGLLNLARSRLVRQEREGASVALEPILTWIHPLLARGDADALYLAGKVHLRMAKDLDGEQRTSRLDEAHKTYRTAAEAFEARGARRRAAAAWKEAGLAAQALRNPTLSRDAFEAARRLDKEIKLPKGY